MEKANAGGRGGRDRGGRDRGGRDRGGRDRGGRDRGGPKAERRARGAMGGGGRGGGKPGGGGNRNGAKGGGGGAHRDKQHPATGEKHKEAAKKELRTIGIKPTSENRTVKKQANEMLKAAEKKPKDDLNKYGKGAYVKTMREWVRKHPNASRAQGVKAFENIIRNARTGGAKVSDHLDKRAIDIPEPTNSIQREKIMEIIRRNGGVLKKEPGAAGGPHWHISFPNKKNK